MKMFVMDSFRGGWLTGSVSAAATRSVRVAMILSP
jgi:hypothetical protein